MEGGLKKVTFARTPIMSVYLLAFIVGEYEFVEAMDANGVRVRVYTPVGKAEDGRFALDVSTKHAPLLSMHSAGSISVLCSWKTPMIVQYYTRTVVTCIPACSLSLALRLL